MDRAYHASPAKFRDDVLSEGIAPDSVGGAIYLFDTEELAQRQARILSDSWPETPRGTADIWSIDMTGIDATLHPHVNDGENVTTDVERIGPERFTLAATF
jgi:hypothetical protein